MKVCIFIFLTLLTSCQLKNGKKKLKITSYKFLHDWSAIPNHIRNGPGDDYIYYYIIANESDDEYYYYSSPSPVTDFKSIQWVNSKTNPINEEDVEEAEEETDLLIPIEEVNITPDMETNITEAETFESSEGNSDSGNSGSSSDGGGDGGGD